MSLMLDPLQLGESQRGDDDSLRHPESDDERAQLPSTSPVDGTSAVLHWSTDKARSWLLQNVPFRNDRMQECLRAFEKEGVDGLSLLTLQRNHRACLGMSDFEWVLLKSARKRLLAGCDKVDPIMPDRLEPRSHLSYSFWTPPPTPTKVASAMTPPSSLHSIRANGSMGMRHTQESTFLSSPLRFFNFPKLRWSFDSAKDEQIELLMTEVQSLRGEVVSAEERETTLQAQLNHLDEELRTTQLAGYLYTRTRWTLLPGEPPIADDVDIDDWLQRFLVLQGSSIFFYVRSTDLRPQGTILLSEIVEAGPLPAHAHQGDKQRWFSFHITTCHGLRLECLTPLKLQMDLWLTLVRVDYEAGDSLHHSFQS